MKGLDVTYASYDNDEIRNWLEMGEIITGN